MPELLDIRGLSLLQPWATLVALGLKRLETRSWTTEFRGLLAIHASRGRSAQVRRLCEEDPMISAALAGAGLHYDQLPTGGILAVAGLGDVLSMQEAPVGTKSSVLDLLDAQQLTDREKAFGVYEPGRFAWQLQDVQALLRPVSCKGSLRLWRLPDEVHQQVVEQLKSC